MLKKIILVLNCGSSSLKFSVIDTCNNKEYITGIAECLNLPEAKIKWKINNIKNEELLGYKAKHNNALYFLVTNILPNIKDISDKIIAVGHRVVHGGVKLTKSVIIDNNIIDEIKNSIPFAPLHNPAHLIGIYQSFEMFPHLSKKNVAVFDTSFHQTMPEESYLYALPYFLYQKYGIRRYGAHGISHFYVTQKAAKILNSSIDKINIITCHLGNGSSISAIKNGKCIDTSMGFTPQEGLVMGTRSGDIDPSIIFYMHNYLGMSISKIEKILTRESGILGLTNGITSDCRYIENNYYKEESSKRAMNVYCHRLSKYISSYIMLMEGKLDALVFTGGIGENSAMVREISLKKLHFLGFKLNNKKNSFTKLGRTEIITSNSSNYPVIVIPTNEELVIAQETSSIVG